MRNSGNRTEQLATLSWLAQPATADLTNDARHARETWFALAQQPQFRKVLTEATLDAIDAALGDVQTKPEYNPDMAMTLCHGDCHLDNLLRDQEGRLIWADWQEIRIGNGPSDLTFLSNGPSKRSRHRTRQDRYSLLQRPQSSRRGGRKRASYYVGDA
jgi:thiamine kinase-like enzyme